MTETDMESLLLAFVDDFAGENDLPITAKTLKDLQLSDSDKGIIVKVGSEEFLLKVTQTV